MRVAFATSGCRLNQFESDALEDMARSAGHEVVAPDGAPELVVVNTCTITHDSGNVIDFPVIDDVPSLMWVINLGCIDLNQWYARCDDVNRPDYVHFDLDPGEGAAFEQVLKSALIVREALEALKMKPLVNSSFHISRCG